MTLSGSHTMREVLAALPGAQRALFKRYHIGGCASCGFSPDETLAAVCARNDGLPVQEVIAHLAEAHEADQAMLASPAEVAASRTGGAAPALVDLRTREEWDAVRIPGSVLFTQELMQEMLGRWDRTAPVVFVDHQGTRVLDAAAYFSGHGFERARGLRGGIDAWSLEVAPELPRYSVD